MGLLAIRVTWSSTLHPPGSGYPGGRLRPPDANGGHDPLSDPVVHRAVHLREEQPHWVAQAVESASRPSSRR